MRYLTLEEIMELHRMVLAQTGGAAGVRDLGALESSVAQPRMAFGGQDLESPMTMSAPPITASATPLSVPRITS
jgi:prophage maintenance system killer protein